MSAKGSSRTAPGQESLSTFPRIKTSRRPSSVWPGRTRGSKLIIAASPSKSIGIYSHCLVFALKGSSFWLVPTPASNVWLCLLSYAFFVTLQICKSSTKHPFSQKVFEIYTFCKNLYSLCWVFNGARLCHCSQGWTVNNKGATLATNSTPGERTVQLLFPSQYSDFAQLRCHGSIESVSLTTQRAWNVISLYVKLRGPLVVRIKRPANSNLWFSLFKCTHRSQLCIYQSGAINNLRKGFSAACWH